MASDSEYHQQLGAVNQLLEQTPEGPQRGELLSLKQNIEELLLLTVEPSSDAKSESNSSESDSKLDDEYMLFMAEMSKEGAVESSDSTVKHFKELEGKKFRAPHKHQWGQLVYHNAMVCSVPDDSCTINELQVKVLFLNPTHKEMLPCPYFFDLEKDCHFSEGQCRFSHGELVSYSSLQDYAEPKFEDLAVGSEVLAKQSDNLWYRGKIAEIMKERCLVKFDSRKDRNENYEEIVFEHILPLEQADNGSDDDDDSLSSSEFQVVDEWNGSDEEELPKAQKQKKLINMSLMNTPDTVALGDWEKHTKGIGSKLMQKMGYIVGTGLGKKGSGIVKPVTAQILPQGKSLDFCMNLKTKAKNPNLFNVDNKSKQNKKALKKMEKKAKKMERKANKKLLSQQKLKNMDLDEYITWYFGRSKVPTGKEDDQNLRDKLKTSDNKAVNVASFRVEAQIEKMAESVERLKTSIRRLEGLGQNPKGLRFKLPHHELSLKQLTHVNQVIRSELNKRKTSKQMTMF